MRYLLDTNVLSERNRPRPDPHVTKWIGQLPREDVALSTITFGEIQKGILKLEPGAKRTLLARWLATAAVHDLVLVTRNERDCGQRGVDILNPWNA